MACRWPRRSGSLAGLAAVAAAALGAPAAHAADSLTTVKLHAVGALTVNWHGDAAAGCAAAGMCEYSGTTTFRPRPEGAEIEIDHFDNDVDVSGFLENKGRSEARVSRALAGGGTEVCRDGASEATFTLDARRAYRDRWSTGIGTQVIPSPLLNGNCAGPRLGEVAGALPTVAFRLRDIQRVGARLGFQGRFPFRAGPLTGEVVSTVALRATSVRKEKFGGGGGPPEKGRERQAFFVEADFAVTGGHGSVGADFHGVGGSACQRFDACGATGSERWSLADGRGRLTVFGTIFTKHRPASLEKAFALAAEKGELDGFGQLRRGTSGTTDTLVRPGAPACTDQVTPALPGLVLDRHKHKARLTFGETGFEASADAGLDLLDGHCPGPTQGDVLHGSSLANAMFPATALAKRELHLVFGRKHAFSGPAYAGNGRTRVELDLTRTHADIAPGTVIEFGSTKPGPISGGTIQRP